ncbi:MAG: response regulator [Porphyromonadaceae bacterium]|nr:MAG: response regulator [Porphyromonadaceae bacterium]
MNELILVAEDSRTQALLLKNLLQSHNFKVGIAEDGLKACDWFSENKPALVISDIMMPEMNGYELCRQIKSNIATKDIPVILLTSLSNPERNRSGIVFFHL